ncbi:AraC family transcriptional regulator [Pseudoalteromonas prydzensis]|uniref:AraC family transcriptional regulator n=1 Tax=Pseudoalteromonas prydzensis TaxID=182141 RepID=UPI0007E50A10|nr:AraC family transcriptional regulator [Pseudoalteromonas prydzensis]MBE0376312.1 hypothetical protein [Pseudoalteromonas prydzensis ACAM 620]
MSNKQTLTESVLAVATQDGIFNTQIAALTLVRRSNVSEPMPCVYGLGLGVTVQGGKRVTLGEDIYDYADGQTLVASVDVPVVSHITSASVQRPFLGLHLSLDSKVLGQAVANMDFNEQYNGTRQSAMSVVDADDGILDAINRLIKLLTEPQLIPLVAPLIQEEIVFRLLQSPHSYLLRQVVTAGSASQKIAKILYWLKQNYKDDFSIVDLAAEAHMSESTFRQHFREVTKLSPLQYIKNLRLQEARQLMLNQRLDANTAALQVGYESASQFSREYTRFFGRPPLKDINALRLSNAFI